MYIVHCCTVSMQLKQFTQLTQFMQLPQWSSYDGAYRLPYDVLVFFANQQPHVLWPPSPWTACFFPVVICSLKCATTTWSQNLQHMSLCVALLTMLTFLRNTSNTSSISFPVVTGSKKFSATVVKTYEDFWPCVIIEYSRLKFARTTCDALC